MIPLLLAALIGGGGLWIGRQTQKNKQPTVIAAPAPNPDGSSAGMTGMAMPVSGGGAPAVVSSGFATGGGAPSGGGTGVNPSGPIMAPLTTTPYSGSAPVPPASQGGAAVAYPGAHPVTVQAPPHDPVATSLYNSGYTFQQSGPGSPNGYFVPPGGTIDQVTGGAIVPGVVEGAPGSSSANWQSIGGPGNQYHPA